MRIGDFALRGGRVHLVKTGNSAALDLRLVREVAGWLACHLIVRVAGALRLRPRRTIWFTPDVPHHRYMIRAAATFAGIRPATGPDGADASFFFEDATVSPPRAAPPGPAFNFACTDISKSRVAAVFAEVFGYPLAIDPRTWAGPAVEKGEANGAHDGRIVACPRDPAPGMTYQRLIDTLDGAGRAVDLRTHVVGGRIVAVWEKRRAADARFLPPNVSAAPRRPARVFAPAERMRIAAFCRAMGADWASLDVLRDADGRIYVVDVNKTDAGPIAALSFCDRLAAVARLSRALDRLLGSAVRTRG